MCKLIHYRAKCIGCGVCQEMHPDLWRMSSKDGKATLVKGLEKKNVFIRDVPYISAEYFDGLVKACPVNVIKTG